MMKALIDGVSGGLNCISRRDEFFAKAQEQTGGFAKLGSQVVIVPKKSVSSIADEAISGQLLDFAFCCVNTLADTLGALLNRGGSITHLRNAGEYLARSIHVCAVPPDYSKNVCLLKL